MKTWKTLVWYFIFIVAAAAAVTMMGRKLQNCRSMGGSPAGCLDGLLK
jgi:hypothetical protein